MSMELRACCCVKPRTGAVIAGIIDLILGTLGILAIALHHSQYFDTMSDNTSSNGAANESSGASSETNPTTVLPPNTEDPPALNSAGETSSTVEEVDSTNHHHHRWNAVICLYAFAFISAILHGILVLIAAARKQVFFNGAAMIVNVLMILGGLGGTVALFILGYHWFDLIVMPPIVALQAYFLWVGHDYQKYFSYSQPINVKSRA